MCVCVCVTLVRGCGEGRVVDCVCMCVWPPRRLCVRGAVRVPVAARPSCALCHDTPGLLLRQWGCRREGGVVKGASNAVRTDTVNTPPVAKECLCSCRCRKRFPPPSHI